MKRGEIEVKKIQSGHWKIIDHPLFHVIHSQAYPKSRSCDVFKPHNSHSSFIARSELRGLAYYLAKASDFKSNLLSKHKTLSVFTDSRHTKSLKTLSGRFVKFNDKTLPRQPMRQPAVTRLWRGCDIINSIATFPRLIDVMSPILESI